MKYKFCKDCKWFEEIRGDYWSDWCKSPLGSRDLVTGERIQIEARKARYDKNLCGRGAKWFQPK